MSPTWARKGSKRWRYYVSQAALRSDKSKLAPILRVPAADVEELVAEAVGNLSDASPADIRNLIDRLVISHATIRIQLSEVADGSDGARVLTLPWKRPSPYRKREILQGADNAKTYGRPMPATARAILIEALRDAHRWLRELPWKRNFAARDFRPHAPPMSRRDGGMDLADRLLPPQIEEMPSYPAD